MSQEGSPQGVKKKFNLEGSADKSLQLELKMNGKDSGEEDAKDIDSSSSSDPDEDNPVAMAADNSQQDEDSTTGPSTVKKDDDSSSSSSESD